MALAKEEGSVSSLQHPIEYPVSKSLLDSIQYEAYDWACVNGLVMYNKADLKLTHAPVTLLPTPFPRKLYEQAWALGPDFNLLVHKISADTKFLIETLQGASDDAFTMALLDILKTVEKEGARPARNIELGIHRSDYMIHAPATSATLLHQVELNTIAASFSNLSAQTGRLHKFLVSKLGLGYNIDNFPVNNNIPEIPKAIFRAWQLYVTQGTKDAVVVMIVHDSETNTFDQRWLEYTLWENHGIRLLRRSLGQIAATAKLNNNRELVIGDDVVAVTYFRAGYTPDDYPTKQEWEARLLIERSQSVKCPSVSYHLAGTKKVQQVLAVPGVLERFISDEAVVKRLRGCFTGLYSLGDGEQSPPDPQIITKAKEHPERFVMKPQREGGGNNIYGTAIRNALETMTPHQLGSYILMDRIEPPMITTYMMRNQQVFEASAVSELGIFSVFVSAGDEIAMNDSVGYLLRTKVSSSDEGGVAAGFGVLDSPYLI